jgi:hypothetical protein
VKKIIESNFYPVLTWHPSWPRKAGEKLEPELWEETNGWDPSVILWLVSPDKKVHEPIKYHDVKNAHELEAQMRAILKKSGVALIEPKTEK